MMSPGNESIVFPEILTPRKIHNAPEQQQLVIYWHDGSEHVIGYHRLRSACRCASCRADTAMGKIPLIPIDLKVEKINNLGQGLQFVFSDGHERGIFPWKYLFEIGLGST